MKKDTIYHEKILNLLADMKIAAFDNQEEQNENEDE